MAGTTKMGPVFRHSGMQTPQVELDCRGDIMLVVCLVCGRLACQPIKDPPPLPLL